MCTLATKCYTQVLLEPTPVDCCRVCRTVSSTRTGSPPSAGDKNARLEDFCVTFSFFGVIKGAVTIENRKDSRRNKRLIALFPN